MHVCRTDVFVCSLDTAGGVIVFRPVCRRYRHTANVAGRRGSPTLDSTTSLGWSLKVKQVENYIRAVETHFVCTREVVFSLLFSQRDAPSLTLGRVLPSSRSRPNYSLLATPGRRPSSHLLLHLASKMQEASLGGPPILCMLAHEQRGQRTHDHRKSCCAAHFFHILPSQCMAHPWPSSTATLTFPYFAARGLLT